MRTQTHGNFMFPLAGVRGIWALQNKNNQMASSIFFYNFFYFPLFFLAVTAAFAGATAGYDFPHNGQPLSSEM
jgi:hypothetical protein